LLKFCIGLPNTLLGASLSKDFLLKKITMGIFDIRPLKVRARKLLALAHKEEERGQIAFARQLRAQARKYLRECAAMDPDSDDQMDIDRNIR
jgi:hypothetical protein